MFLTLPTIGHDGIMVRVSIYVIYRPMCVHCKHSESQTLLCEKVEHGKNSSTGSIASQTVPWPISPYFDQLHA